MPANRIVTRITDADDAVGGKVPVSLGGSGAATAAGAKLNLGAASLGAVRGPGLGNVRVDPSGRVIVHRGLSQGTGAALPNADGLNHNAFPALDSTATGRLICGYRRGTGHSEPNSSTGAYWVCKFSDDMGASWSATPTVIYGNPSGDTREGPLRRLRLGTHAGRIVTLLNPNFNSGATGERAMVSYSDDHGATWSTAVSIYDSARWGVSGRQMATSLLELADGTLLASFYGWGTPQVNSRYTSTVYASADGGVTWTYRGVIDDGTYLDRQPEEPFLRSGLDGNIYSAVRYDGDRYIRFYKSTDNGATWTSPSTPLGSVPGFGRPGFIQLSTGAWVCVTRHPTTTNPVYYTSRDYCVTWESGLTLDERTLPQYVYSDLIEVAPGVAGLAYAVEYPSTGAYASANFTYLLDGAARSPLGGSVAVTNGSLPPVPPLWTAPPAKSVDTTAANLKATQDAIIDYLVAVGLSPASPGSLASCFSWWEPDFIPSTVNDYAGPFTAGDSTNTVPAISRNDGTTLAGSAVSGTWGVSSNQLYCSSGAGLYTWDSGKASLTIQADVTYSTNAASIIFRYVDASNYLELQYGGFAMRIRKTVAGVGATLASSGSYSPTSGVQATIKVVLSGASLSVYAVDAGGTLPTTPTITYTLTSGEQATFLTPTKVGFVASANTSRYDNLSLVYGLASGDAVGLLSDRTANASDLTTTGSNRPGYTVLTGYFRDKPALLFNGTHYLRSAAFSAKAAPNALTGVFYLPQTTASFQKIAGQGAGGSGGQQTLSITSAAKLQINAGTGVVAASAETFPYGPHVITAYFNGASSVLRVDGRVVLSGDAGAGTWTQAILGDDANASLFYTAGMACFHGSTSLADAILAERYFALKYAIPLGV